MPKAAEPYKEGTTWSMRRRVLGENLYVSGRASKKAAKQAMDDLVRPLMARGQPKGYGPLQTTLGQALQDHALECLPFRKGAVQDANRMNRWLRAAGLQTLTVQPNGDNAQPGNQFEVKLEASAAGRVIPQGLQVHRETLAKKSAKSDQIREQLARMAFAEVERYHVQELINALQSEGKQPATVRQEQALLRSLFNHARTSWNWGLPTENPATSLKVRWADNSRDRVMSKAEQARLDEAIAECRNQLLAPTILLYTETAMRASEPIANACWSDVDWEAKVIRLRDSKNDKRDVPLSPAAIQALRTLQSHTGGELDAPIVSITYESLKAAWGRACERAGVDNLRIQDLRHTAATRMALSSGNVFLVKALTGHKTMAMVERYVNVKATDVVEFMHGAASESASPEPPSTTVPTASTAPTASPAAPASKDAEPQATPADSPGALCSQAGESRVIQVDFGRRQRTC